MGEILPIHDICGNVALLRDIVPSSHFIDIRVRYNGEYYWFEGDFIKYILPHLELIKEDNGISAKLQSHKENTRTNTLKDTMIEVLAEQLTIFVVTYEDDQRWERMTDTELHRRERAAWIGQAKVEALKRLEVQGE